MGKALRRVCWNRNEEMKKCDKRNKETGKQRIKDEVEP
jgi:hypothetical protein